MAKTILQKYWDGTAWIEIHPVTTTSDVYDEQGKTTEEKFTALLTQLNELTLIVNNMSNPFTMSLSSDASTIELGITIDSINFSWAYNKTPFSQKFENIPLNVDLRAYNYTTAISSDKTFTLSAVPYEGGDTKTHSMLVQFLNGIYYGTSSSTTYNNALISSLVKELSNTKSRTITVDALSDQYIYYCIPSRLGTVAFKVGGFDGGFAQVSTISFTNINGYTEDYDVYRSDNIALGDTSVEIQ